MPRKYTENDLHYALLNRMKDFLLELTRDFCFMGSELPLSAEERGARPGEFPYYGASGVIDPIDEYIFNDDFIVVSEDGANLLNRSSPIAFVARGKYWVNNHAHILRPFERQLLYWSERIEAINLTPVVTSSAQPKLTIEALMNLRVAVPPNNQERSLNKK